MCSVRTVISIYQRPNGRVPIYKEGNKMDHSSTNATNGCQPGVPVFQSSTV